MIRGTRAKVGGVVRYVAAVGAAAAIDLGGFVILTHLGVMVAAAAATSFALAATFNYSLSSLFVFRRRLTAARFAVFLAVGLVGLAVNTGVTTVAYGLGAAPALAKICGIGVAFFFNAAANVVVVFRGAPSRPQDVPDTLRSGQEIS